MKTIKTTAFVSSRFADRARARNLGVSARSFPPAAPTPAPSAPATPATHMLGERVSVRCRRSFLPGDKEFSWLAGAVIATEPATQRYVVQLDDNRRVVAFGDDVRRWTLSFEVLEVLEKLAS